MNRIPSLEALGLTNLEALAYAFLVGHPAATGYGVAKGIGKPTANVYRALESLERKGAVTTDRGTPPRFRPVPPAQLFDHMERDFHGRREIAARALASLAAEADAKTEAVFNLATMDQVTGRARIMLTAARRIVVVDVAPVALAAIDEAIDDVRRRGARALVLVRGAAAGGDPDTVSLPARSPSDDGVIRAVVDAREAMIAVVSADGTQVRDAVWTRSPLFARTLHDALANELFYCEIERGLGDGLSVDEMEVAFERCRKIRTLV